MKKTIIAVSLHMAILIAIIAVLGSASGTVEQEGQAQFTGELERNVVIRILENDTAKEQGYLQELLDAFNAEYAEYGIVAVDANMDQYSDLENDGPYGYGPDVLYQANDRIMRYVAGRHIQPIPVEQLDCYSEISESAWEAYTTEVSGQEYIFGVPVNVQGPLLYYRKDLLPDNWEEDWDDDKNGVPDMVENWNDMYAFSLWRKSQGNETFGYMKSLFDPYFAVGYLYSYGAYSFGNNNTDPSDIGYSAGDSELGGWVIRQLASIMNEWCIDDTITVNAYNRLARGDYFATMTTPDVYTLFIDEMVAEGMTREEAVENLVVTSIPKLPASGDLSEGNPELIDSKMMGGVNGYAISSYTKAPNACLAFVNFATSYEMMKLRSEMLGVVPARNDTVLEVGGLALVINRSLEEGNIIVMPSIKENAQMWTPLQTFFTDVAQDAYRAENEVKYASLEAIKTALQNVDQQIYDAIFTLQE
ncbi:MAG: extracellular solute-binding protein [Clostridia bacterium]|nr:extracellular solute-binding protein [Clostridia bacterium]